MHNICTYILQSYTGSGASPYGSLSPMDELPSPTGGVSSVAQVSSSVVDVEGGVMQAAASTSL